MPIISPEVKSKARNRKVSALGVCGFIEGVLQVIPVDGNFTAGIIVETVEQQILPRDAFLVADNASIHNEPRLCAILDRKNIVLVKLPAYAYDLNPMGMVFGQAKAIARFTPGFFEDNPFLAILSAFQQIRPFNVRNFYQRSWSIVV
jgi:hypothetical protein